MTPVLVLVKRALHANGAGLLTGVTVSNACTGGGTVTIDATLKNENTFSNGDTITMTAKNRNEDGDAPNGTLSIAVSGVSGDGVITQSSTLTWSDFLAGA